MRDKTAAPSMCCVDYSRDPLPSIFYLFYHLPPLRGLCIIFGCMRGTTERADRLVCPLAGDNRALIALVLTHDVIVLADLGFWYRRTLRQLAQVGFFASANPGICSTATARPIVKIRMFSSSHARSA
jgi:hypothetical protein